MLSTIVRAGLLLLLGAQYVASTALDDYVWAPDENYKWVDMVSLILVVVVIVVVVVF
jgi:hypothetical protein